MEIVSGVIGALAFLMSGISLWWQIARARADRPQLHVEGVAACSVMQEDYSTASWSFEITVANIGSAAITVDDACWALYKSDGLLRVKNSGQSPSFPLRLEGKDSRTWTYEMPIHGTRWDGLLARPVVDYVARPPRWRRKDQSVRRTLLGKTQTLHIPPDWKVRIDAAR